MAEEVKFDPSQEADKVKAQFEQLIQQRDQVMKQRSEADRKLNEIGANLARLQGAYEMAMKFSGKDAAGNELVIPPTPKKGDKKGPTETPVKKRKKNAKS